MALQLIAEILDRPDSVPILTQAIFYGQAAFLGFYTRV
jgi:hypothetical protein